MSRLFRKAGQRRGVTLVELMIVLVVMAVIIAAAFPSIMDSVRNQATENAANRFLTVLKAARYRAVAFNRPIGVIVNAGDGTVSLAVSNDTTCSSMGTPQVWLDVDTEFPEAQITSSSVGTNLLCFRTNGQIANASGGPLTAGVDVDGAVLYTVARADLGTAAAHRLVVPFNGMARFDNQP